MKFVLALSALLASAVSAETKYDMARLMANAKPTPNSRLLEQNNQDYVVDISGYSVKFEQCQFVRAYDEELAENEESSTVLTTKRFVKFRLCPNDDCDSCEYNYGEYLIDLADYLDATVQYFQNYQEEMCNACDENCQNNNQQQDDEQDNQDGGRFLQQYNVDCSSCYEECQKIENMEENGYMDATDFIECQMIYDAGDDNGNALYAGPVCASGGTQINIGVFKDEDCLIPDSSKKVNDYLINDNGALKLSHALLKKTYKDTCVSCKEPEEWDENENNNQQDNNDQDDADVVIEMCEMLYDAAAKCEQVHGFDTGYADYGQYTNQASQEETVCDFMESITSGTYTETGEIQVTGSNMVGGKDSTTGGQKLALTFFILGTVAMAVYAAMLHTKLVKGGKADLSTSGGAMA